MKTWVVMVHTSMFQYILIYTVFERHIICTMFFSGKHSDYVRVTGGAFWPGGQGAISG